MMNKIAIIAAAMALFVGCSDDSGSNSATENAPKMTCVQERPWLYSVEPRHEVGSCEDEYKYCYNLVKECYWECDDYGFELFGYSYTAQYKPRFYAVCIEVGEQSEFYSSFGCKYIIEARNEYLDPYKNDSVSTNFAELACEQYIR